MANIFDTAPTAPTIPATGGNIFDAGTSIQTGKQAAAGAPAVAKALDTLSSKVSSFMTPAKTPTQAIATGAVSPAKSAAPSNNQAAFDQFTSSSRAAAPSANIFDTAKADIKSVPQAVASLGPKIAGGLSNIWNDVKAAVTTQAPTVNGQVQATDLPMLGSFLPDQAPKQPATGPNPAGQKFQGQQLSQSPVDSAPANSFQDMLSHVGLPREIVSNPVTSVIGNAFDDSVDKIGSAISTMSGSAPVSKKVGSSLNAASSVANLIFSPISAAFGVADSNKTLKPFSHAIEYPFQKIQQGVNFGVSHVISALPISQQAKDNLTQPISDILGLVAQIYAGDLAAEKGIPMIRDKVAEVKTTLSQNLIMNTLAHTDDPAAVEALLTRLNVPKDTIDGIKNDLAATKSVADVKDVLTGNARDIPGPKEADISTSRNLPAKTEALGEGIVPEHLNTIAESVKKSSASLKETPVEEQQQVTANDKSISESLPKSAEHFNTPKELNDSIIDSLKDSFPGDQGENIKYLKSRDYEIKQLDVSDIHEATEWGKYADEGQRANIEKIKSAISSGEKLPPLIVTKEGYVTDGHHRLQAYKEAGIEKVPVLEIQKPSGGSGKITNIQSVFEAGHPVDKPLDAYGTSGNNDAYGTNTNRRGIGNDEAAVGGVPGTTGADTGDSEGRVKLQVQRVDAEISRMAEGGDNPDTEHGIPAGYGTERIEEIRRHAEDLIRGRLVRVTEDTPIVLKAMGAPEAITNSIGSYIKKGAFSDLVMTKSLEGREVFGGYLNNILYMNADEFGSNIYKTGEILQHELGGHSLWEKSTLQVRMDYMDGMIEDSRTVKKVWDLANQTEIGSYWEDTIGQIRAELLSKMSETDANRLMVRADLTYDPKESTNSVIDRSLELRDSFGKLNAELRSKELGLMRLHPENTVIIGEHFAVISEKAQFVNSTNPELQEHIEAVRNAAEQYPQERQSRQLEMKSMSVKGEGGKSPKEILADAEAKAEKPSEQKTRFMALDRAVEESSTHNDFMDAVRKDPLLADNMDKMAADLRDNGYSNAIDYYAKRKIDFNTKNGVVPQRTYAAKSPVPKPRDTSGELNREGRSAAWNAVADVTKQPDLKDAPEIIEKGKEMGFTVPELESDRVADIFDIVAQTELLKNHPAKPFFRYVNSRGQLPELISDHPGVYDAKMKALLEKQGVASVPEAQKLVDDYVEQNTRLSELYSDKYDPIEIAQRDSVHKTPFSEMEKERLAAKGGDEAKPMDTVVDQNSMVKKGNDVMKKVGEHDLFRTPDRVLEKIGLKAESDLIKKQYGGYLKELPKNIERHTQWAKRVPGKDSARKIFDYLDGNLVDKDGFLNPDVLTAEEKRVGDEIRSYLDDWGHRLGLKPHERLTNYITHVFENDLISKEFDVDFAKIITDKVAGSVYDPFLEQRLGKLGYIRDVWRALDAYVKRATRKVYMDPALSRIKIASEDLDLQSIAYVKNYIDQINMRPTDRENRWDNTIKQIVGYKFGGRPTARISKSLRQMVFRGSLGLNLSSALRNLSQSANSYALLGEKNMIVGAVKMLSRENNAELSREGVLGLDQIQDRTISSTKKFWSTVDKGLFFAFETAERINRGVTYFGAKNKYYSENSKTSSVDVDGKTQKVRVYSEGASEQKAIEYAKGIVSKTQFTFSSVDTPLVLRGDIAKTLLQFQSFNLKQAEFMAEMAKDKNYAGMVRWLAASLLFVYGIGQVFGMKWQDLIPFYSMITGDYNPPPIPAVAVALGKNLLGTTDQFGQPLTLEKRLKNLGNAALPFVPFGSQAKKTLAGIDAITSGEATTIAEKAKALAFGAKANDNAAAGKALDKNLKTTQAKVDGFDKALVDQVRPVFEQAKAAGYGTPEADDAIASLTDNEYTVYKALKAADVAQSNVDLEAKVLPIVQQAYKLGFGTDAADKLIADSFPATPEGDREYDAYNAAKNSLYGKTQGNESADGTSSTSVAGKWDQQSFFQHIGNIAQAVGTDPVTAFNDIFAGNSSWKITGLTNGQIMVERLPMADSEAIKASLGGKSSKFKLDHSVSLEAGGNNGADNLVLLPTGDKDTVGSWAWNSPTENLIGSALKSGKITGKQAREYMIRFKMTANEPLSPAFQKEFKDKYGSKSLTPDEIRDLVK